LFQAIGLIAQNNLVESDPSFNNEGLKKQICFEKMQSLQLQTKKK